MEMVDEDVVSKSYLSIFFLDLNNLKDSLTGYRSIILRLKIKTTDSFKDTMENLKTDDQMKNALIQWSDSVRHNVDRCHIAASALSEVIKELDVKPLKETYMRIINQFTPDLEDVSYYTFEMNKIFVKGTIERVLNKMESFYEQFTKK